jgi:hypothetical protein
MGLTAREWLALWGRSDMSHDEKPHLRYPSIWRWLRTEGVPIPIPRIADTTERKRRQQECEELWTYLLAQHLAGLPEDEQQAFQEGRHPSQSHDRAEAAELAAEQLRAELVARGIAAEVSVARYLDGRTVLDVLLPECPLDEQWADDLNFFRGYEAHVCVRSPERSPHASQRQAEPSAIPDPAT